MMTRMTFFFNADGAAEQQSEWHCGQYIGRSDSCEVGAANYTEGKKYTFHVGYGVMRKYVCVAVDKTAAMLQRVPA